MKTCSKCQRIFLAGEAVAATLTGEIFHFGLCPESEREAVIPLITVDIIKQFLISKCSQSDRQKIYEFLHDAFDCRMR